MIAILFFLPCILCVFVAGVLATLGHSGWGWFLFAGVLMYAAGAQA